MGIPTLSFLKKYLSEDELIKLQNKKAIHTEQFNEISLVRLTKDYRYYPRGTIFFDGGIIPGYPRIMRVLHLDNGIRRYLKGRFYIEEKVDGYNVRVAIVHGNPLAFTRGGYICPFTTNRIPSLIDLDFFDRYPGCGIAGEVVGPGSPYNTEIIPYISEDVVFFAFDLFDKEGKNLSVEERYKILEPFKIQQVRKWGPFSAEDTDAIRKVVLELDRDCREGIVMKPISNGKLIKYVTLSSCLRDLQASANLITEIPAGYYVQRILRAVFFSHEFGVPLDDNYLLESARALYLSAEKVVKEVAEGESVKESFQVKTESKDTIEKLIEHLSRSGISAKLLFIEKSDSYYKAKFQKIYKEGTREIHHKLMGHGFFD